MRNCTEASSTEDPRDHEKIWLSWHYHRRSDYLAREFGCAYYHFGTSCGNRLCRYLKGIFNTLKIIMKKDPDIVFIQNPSIILAVIAVFIKPFFKYILINDLHTPFIELPAPMKSLFWKVQHFAIRHSDLTLVTNEGFRRQLKEGRVMILPDALPEFDIKRNMELAGERNVVYICSFSQDEPYENVIRAAEFLDREIHLYITGNYKRAGIAKEGTPSNIHLTGFIPDEEYFRLISSVDMVMVLTEQEGCLVCGAYEGISFLKPLILSDTKSLRSYFSKGSIYIDHDPESIAEGIIKGIGKRTKLKEEIRSLKKDLKKDWQYRFRGIKLILERL